MTGLTVGELFAHAGRRDPDQVAIWDDGQPTTYGELAARVARCRDEMRRGAGLRKGDRVLIMAPNSAAFLATVLACASAGVVAVPVSTQSTRRELAYVLSNCAPGLVLTVGEYLPTVTDAVAAARDDASDATLSVRDITALGAGAPTETHAAPLADDQHDGPEPDDLLYLGYTSGTTGSPKGVEVSHRNRVAAIFLEADEFELGRADRHLVVSPLYHTAPLTFALLHLCLGGSVTTYPNFDAARVAGEFASGRATNTFLAPAALRRVLEAIDDAWHPSAALHAVIVGGAPCPAPTKAEADRRLPGCLYEFYGATEVGIVTTLRPGEQAQRPSSAGRPVIGAEIEIRDAETAGQLPTGEVGQAWVSTLTQASGYFGMPPRTDPRWSYLGDVGYLDDDGYLYLVDRSDDIVITGGVNVYSREVESVLESHPHVGEVAVFGVPDEQWGESVVAVVSVAASADDSAVTVDDLHEHCRGALAAYKRPRVITMVPELPRSQTGKIDKRTLKRGFAQPGSATAVSASTPAASHDVSPEVSAP